MSGGPPAPSSLGAGAGSLPGNVGSSSNSRDVARKHRRGSRESVLPPACKNHLNSLFKEGYLLILFYLNYVKISEVSYYYNKNQVSIFPR